MYRGLALFTSPRQQVRNFFHIGSYSPKISGVTTMEKVNNASTLLLASMVVAGSVSGEVMQWCHIGFHHIKVSITVTHVTEYHCYYYSDHEADFIIQPLLHLQFRTSNLCRT